MERSRAVYRAIDGHHEGSYGRHGPCGSHGEGSVVAVHHDARSGQGFAAVRDASVRRSRREQSRLRLAAREPHARRVQATGAVQAPDRRARQRSHRAHGRYRQRDAGELRPDARKLAASHRARRSVRRGPRALLPNSGAHTGREPLQWVLIVQPSPRELPEGVGTLSLGLCRGGRAHAHEHDGERGYESFHECAGTMDRGIRARRRAPFL